MKSKRPSIKKKCKFRCRDSKINKDKFFCMNFMENVAKDLCEHCDNYVEDGDMPLSW